MACPRDGAPTAAVRQAWRVAQVLLEEAAINPTIEPPALRLNTQKMNIMASGAITSWQIDGGKMEIVTDFIFGGPKSLHKITLFRDPIEKENSNLSVCPRPKRCSEWQCLSVLIHCRLEADGGEGREAGGLLFLAEQPVSVL